MEALFEFDKQLMPMSNVKVDDIGDCAIEAENDEGFFYYIITRTLLGQTEIMEWGPVIPDSGILCSGYHCSYSKVEYKEDKLIKQITFWLNNKGSKITKARVIDAEEALDQVLDIAEQFRNSCGEVIE